MNKDVRRKPWGVSFARTQHDVGGSRTPQRSGRSRACRDWRSSGSVATMHGMRRPAPRVTAAVLCRSPGRRDGGQDRERAAAWRARHGLTGGSSRGALPRQSGAGARGHRLPEASEIEDWVAAGRARSRCRRSGGLRSADQLWQRRPGPDGRGGDHRPRGAAAAPERCARRHAAAGPPLHAARDPPARRSHTSRPSRSSRSPGRCVKWPLSRSGGQTTHRCMVRLPLG